MAKQTAHADLMQIHPDANAKQTAGQTHEQRHEYGFAGKKQHRADEPEKVPADHRPGRSESPAPQESVQKAQSRIRPFDLA